MAWRREHGSDGAIGRAASAWAPWGRGGQVAASAKEAGPLLLGSIRRLPWSRARASCLAREILSSLGIRTLSGAFVDIGQT
jgi:hypothetical protein